MESKIRSFFRGHLHLENQQIFLSNNEIKLIGVGGVENAKQAYTKILVGANLVQLYTGLLYQGPSIVKVITNQISEFLVRDGFSSIEEAVGSLSYKKALNLNNLE